MKILCHVDPWCKEQFAAISSGIASDAEVLFVSGSWALDETGLAKNYYRYVDGASDLADWADAADGEVIARCRLLRSLDTQHAHKHVRATRRAAREMFEANQPDIFICEAIDQFLHDILFQEAHVRGIQAYGFIQSFVNGYFRISERGEMNLVRSPAPEEIEDVRSKLSGDNYVPKFIAKAKKSPRSTYLRIMAGNLARVLYFGTLRLLIKEKYNYHIWTSERTTRQLYAHILPKLSFGMGDWHERVLATQKPVIYVPLQHFPEATIDYWVQDVQYVDYPQRLADLVLKLRNDFHVLIKEHPGVWGYRKPSFYDFFEGQQDVTICPIEVASQDCINISDAVLVWTGSVGFEAALRGKPVLSVSTPYYVHGDRFLKIEHSTSADDIRDFIDRCQKQPVSIEEQTELVAYLLSGLLPGRFQNNGSYDPKSSADFEAANEIGAALRAVYEGATNQTDS